MKRLVVIGMMLCAIARADESSHLKLAEEALSLMDVQRNIEQSFEAVKKMQMAQLKSMNLGAAGTERAADVQNEVMALVQKEFSWENIKQDYIQIYAETFSEEDLKGLIEFYKGPIGRKFVEKTPELMQRSVAISQRQMMNLMPKIQEVTRRAAQAARPQVLVPTPPPSTAK